MKYGYSSHEPSLRNRRVCITGIGIISPLGNSREETWKRVLAGESAAGPITQFDAETWPTRFACEVKNFKLPDYSYLPGHKRFLNRPSEFGLAAALEAVEDSGVFGTVERERFGISVGAGIGAIKPQQLASMLVGLDVTQGLSNLSAKVEQTSDRKLLLQNHPGTLAALIGARWQAQGPATTIHTACASSSQSLGQAFLQIRRGEADAVLAGGADSLAGELLLAGFCLLGALSRRNEDPKQGSRPFDKGRDGFVPSEGAAFLILEEKERALNRNAKIYAEIVGYGETESAYRITDLPEDGRGIVEAMQLAVNSAGLKFDQVDYINAHGTSTELNDRVEALAIRRVFGDSKGFPVRPLVSSTKSEIGHLISAAGAMEAAFSALAIRDSIIPPTVNFEKTDCDPEIDFVPNKCRKSRVKVALSNSIGFGGSNSVLAFRRWEM